jgi:predicted outer membrane lipoprotein
MRFISRAVSAYGGPLSGLAVAHIIAPGSVTAYTLGAIIGAAVGILFGIWIEHDEDRNA